MRVTLVAALVAAAAVASVCADGWHDPSPHRVRFVEVEPGVQLELLDWGGAGRPLILLAGSGMTAHIYDEFAPKLTRDAHVFGITRRGFGASSHPSSGYDDHRLADDVVRVITSSGIVKPVLVGHSMAGGELTTVASQQPDLPSGIVYLDAIADPADLPINDPNARALYEKLPASTRVEQPPDAKTSTFQAYREWQAEALGFSFPESELRNGFETNSDGTRGRYRTSPAIFSQLGPGQMARDYTLIRVPILAFVAGEPPVHPPTDPAERAEVAAYSSARQAFVDRWKEKLRHAPGAVRIVDLPDASHFVFISNESAVLRELRDFIKTTSKS
jgi:pimeloyl-ACP methyl ester carboxylesterase